MNRDDFPRPHPAQNGGTTPVISAHTPWHDAELALKIARRSYNRWLLAGGEDTRSSAIMHVYHTHEALHEVARAITMLIETVRAEAAAQITPGACSDIPRNGGDLNSHRWSGGENRTAWPAWKIGDGSGP